MNFPNTITLFRILLTPFFFTELVSYRTGAEHHRWIALAILMTASLTDALDGFLARVTKNRTALGRFLDPLADKLLLVSGFLGLLFVSALPFRPPLWIIVTIVFRDLVIIVGLILIFLISGTVEVRPNFLGKATTAFQMITLIAILLITPAAVFLWYVTAGLTILSCFAYIFRDLRKLKENAS